MLYYARNNTLPDKAVLRLPATPLKKEESVMFGMQATPYDRRVYEEQLADFLPDHLIDVHVHLWTQAMRENYQRSENLVTWPDLVAPDCTIEDLLESYRVMFPGKTVRPVLMTTPTCILEKGNAYALDCARKEGLPVLYCTRPTTTTEEIRQAFKDGFCGIKPYLNHAAAYIPANEIRIYDFLTPEQLALMDELHGVVMLHISRPGRLADPVNIAQMMEIDEKYPNAKVIIAHIGRAYTPEALGNAFDTLRHTKNLSFDFTANTFTPAMTACLEAVGPKRLMFGSDMPITKIRMYRIVENGTYINVVPRGMYGDVSNDIHMRESDDGDHITTFMYEELLAFKRAAETLHLSRADVEDILCKNAARMFGMDE